MGPTRLFPDAVPDRGSRSRRPRRLTQAILRRCVLAALLGINTAAVAADYPAHSLGAWLVSRSNDQKGCFLTRTYPAPRRTTLQLGLDIDGGNRLTMLNAHWSIRPRERLAMDFRLSNAAFPRHSAIGLAIQGAKGFVTTFGRSFPATFGSSRFLHVGRGGVPVEELDLDGSGAAVAELRRCVGQLRSGSGATQSMREEDKIPVDPFAVKARSDSRK